MSSFDRPKKGIHLWKRAVLHFALCFVMGFFSGFAPTSTTSIFSGQTTIPYQSIKNLGVSTQPIESIQKTVELDSLNRTFVTEIQLAPGPSVSKPLTSMDEAEEELETSERGQLIVITTTRSGDRRQEAFLMRLANALRLVPPPLLWIVVEARSEAPKTDEMLRKTGIMYRHLTFKVNFTDPEVEADHQRNVALNHIEYHRLDGIVLFAGISSTYDLQFFEEIRHIEVFGVWPMANVSYEGEHAVVEGPICSSSKIEGWQRKDLNEGTTHTKTYASKTDMNNGTRNERPSMIDISGFAFNSSILWDPERWGRPSSVQDTSQDSIKFVQQVVLEDETKLRGIPSDCSRVMTWHLQEPRDPPIQT